MTRAADRRRPSWRVRRPPADTQPDVRARAKRLIAEAVPRAETKDADYVFITLRHGTTCRAASSGCCSP